MSRDEFLQVGRAVHGIGFRGFPFVIVFWPAAGFTGVFFVDMVAVAPTIILVEIEARSGLGFSVVGASVGARAQIALKPGHFGIQG